MHAPDFETAQHAAEMAVLRMAAVAVLARHASDDDEVKALRVEVEHDGFGAPSVSVELLNGSGFPVGGFSL